nr:MAG TPA: hypothetical protein [Caudoviricetes sp.]
MWHTHPQIKLTQPHVKIIFDNSLLTIRNLNVY